MMMVVVRIQVTQQITEVSKYIRIQETQHITEVSQDWPKGMRNNGRRKTLCSQMEVS